MAPGGARDPKKSTTDLLARLESFYNPKDADEDSLPESIYLNNLEVSWRVFLLLESTRDEYRNWRHLPFKGGVLDQPAWLMDDLLALKSFALRFEAQLDKRRKKESDPYGRD